MLQVSAEAFPDTRSDAQTFTIGVMPQTPGLPQLAPGADLQINVMDTSQSTQSHVELVKLKLNIVPLPS